MNDAHIHLILVHIPIILVPLGAALLAYSLWRGGEPLRVTALQVFVFAAAVTGVAFSVGEGAEELVENLPTVLESVIEEHEDGAVYALWITVFLGLLSGVQLLGQRLRLSAIPNLSMPTLLVAVLATGALAYTGNQGGKIRHPEAFDIQMTEGGPVHSSGEEHDDD